MDMPGLEGAVASEVKQGFPVTTREPERLKFASSVNMAVTVGVPRMGDTIIVPEKDPVNAGTKLAVMFPWVPLKHGPLGLEVNLLSVMLMDFPSALSVPVTLIVSVFMV
jgi:hypothetical protein